MTWQYPPGPATAPVYAFPNIKLDADDSFPLQINNLVKVDIDVTWSYALGSAATEVTDATALTTADLNTNVAIDMFMDSDATKATSTVDAKYEVMIWLGKYGAATEPIGLQKGAVATEYVNGNTL